MSRTAPALDSYVPLAETTRSGLRESVHYGAAAGIGADGRLAVARGPVGDAVFPRSAAKPFQALACLRAGAELDGPALAMAAGSHSGEPRHAALAEQVLAGVGLTPDALGCPPDWPLHRPQRDALLRAGGERSRTLMNCSGKHAAMLAACVAAGWSTADYLDPAHPVQVLVREAIEEMCGEPVAHTAVDGCGAPQLAVSTAGLARGFRTLAAAPEGSPAARVAAAMRAHPEYVAGEGRDDTAVMRALPGAISKIGAEGVVAIALPSGAAAAVKIADGDLASRARTAVGLDTLARLGADVAPVAELRTGTVYGGGRKVGEIRPV
ncbi:asparaginase [Nocardiopsis coralliicola]